MEVISVFCQLNFENSTFLLYDQISLINKKRIISFSLIGKAVLLDGFYTNLTRVTRQTKLGKAVIFFFFSQKKNY